MRTILRLHDEEQNEAELAELNRQAHRLEQAERKRRMIGHILALVLSIAFWIVFALLAIAVFGMFKAHAAPITASPKVASQQPQPLNVPLAAQPNPTVTVQWINPKQPAGWTAVSNQLAIITPAGATNYVNQSITNGIHGQAVVTAPSNTVIKAMVAAIGANGQVMLSDPSNAVTNTAPPMPPTLATNIYALDLLFSPNLKTWTTNAEMMFTNSFSTNSSGFWRLKLSLK